MGIGTIGITAVAESATIEAISNITPSDGVVIVGDGTTWVGESGATARTSLGLGPQNSPTFGATLSLDAPSGEAKLFINGIGGTDSTLIFDTAGTPIWSVGSDTSNSGAFVISQSGVLGTSNMFVMNKTTGAIVVTNIDTSSANTWNKAQRGAFSTLTDGATVTPDLSLANNFNLVLGGNRTLGVPTNIVAGQTGIITVRQDITGSRTLAYAWPYVFPGGAIPILSTAKLVMDQLTYYVNHYSTSTVTVTIATPGVMTWTAHGLVSGQRLQLTTTGALPTGLSINTTYWVTVIDSNTFNLSTSLANAQTATFIATTGTQSGVHTAVVASITINAILLIS